MRRFFAALAWPLAMLTLALLCAPARAETTAPAIQNAIVELNSAHVTGTTGVASFSGATEGAASVLVTASGFTTATQAATFSCTGTNAISVGLLPVQ